MRCWRVGVVRRVDVQEVASAAASRHDVQGSRLVVAVTKACAVSTDPP
jgi:hypothetical protein